MIPIGYAKLHETVAARALAPARPGFIATSVNKRTEKDDRILFPTGVAIEDSLLGHIEFALRHEDLQLGLLREALLEIPADMMANRYREAPNGAYVRRAIYYWEWFQGKALGVASPKTTQYEPLLDPELYEVAGAPTRAPRFRILDNHLGNAKFCPVVRRDPNADSGLLAKLAAELQEILERASAEGDELYERTLSYLYLSETRSSWRIEREDVPVTKERAFAKLLQQAGEKKDLTEDWLVELQHLAVRDAFSHEFNFRGKQNFLEDNAGRLTYLPPAPAYVPELMTGLMEFVNDTRRGIDPIVKAACASFAFVYIHPFMDGNGRLHRFLLHHVLAQSGILPPGLVIPVSAALYAEGKRYLEVLKGFSEPVTELWEYRRGDHIPHIIREPGKSAYGNFDATRETALVRHALMQAVRVEVPNEMTYLHAYRSAKEAIERELDVAAGELATLIKGGIDRGGHLSKHRREQFNHLGDEKLNRIEAIVSQSVEKAKAAIGGDAQIASDQSRRSRP